MRLTIPIFRKLQPTTDFNKICQEKCEYDLTRSSASFDTNVMGLDLAELVICTEEEFGIAFDENNSVWQKTDATFGDVVDEVRRLIAEKKPQSDVCGSDCRYETVLIELQNLLKEMFPQRNVSETERIARIVPYRKQWKYLAVIRKQFPEIMWKTSVYLEWIAVSFFTVVGAAFTIIEMFVINKITPINTGLGTLITIVFTGMSMAMFIAFMIIIIMRYIPPVGTIGDYAQQIFDNRQRMATKRQQWNEWLETNDVKIEVTLRQIFADTLALKPKIIKRESRLWKDMHIG